MLIFEKLYLHKIKIQSLSQNYKKKGIVTLQTFRHFIRTTFMLFFVVL